MGFLTRETQRTRAKPSYQLPGSPAQKRGGFVMAGRATRIAWPAFLLPKVLASFTKSKFQRKNPMKRILHVCLFLAFLLAAIPAHAQVPSAFPYVKPVQNDLGFYEHLRADFSG